MNPTPGPPTALPAGHWDAAALGPVREINEQVIELLCELATGGGAGALPALVRQEFRSATPAARRRLADCPYLLVDAGFAHPERWLAAATVHDRPVAAPPGPAMVDCGVRLARRARQRPRPVPHATPARYSGGLSGQSTAALARTWLITVARSSSRRMPTHGSAPSLQLLPTAS